MIVKSRKQKAVTLQSDVIFIFSQSTLSKRTDEEKYDRFIPSFLNDGKNAAAVDLNLHISFFLFPLLGIFLAAFK